ncbi:flagellar assembly protein FliW [Brevibacillus fluminis]|nr:flagellar assembly protein FliW [Brevibacillus fluminis]
MLVQTPLFGEISIDREKVVTFQHGIPGFENEKQFVFLPMDDSLFTVMQSVTSSLHFIVVRPFQLFPDYDFEIPTSFVNQLEIKEPDEVVIYNIVVLHDDWKKSTVNMQAPIVINSRNGKGLQIVLNQYKIKQPLFPQSVQVKNG